MANKATEKENFKSWWKERPRGTIFPSLRGEIICADSLQFLNALQEDCADLIFLDPPFNLGKKYGQRCPKADKQFDNDYEKYIKLILKRSVEVLRPGGALYLYHLPRWAICFSSYLNDHLDFRHWIAIAMKNGFARGQRLYPAHYALLYFTKGQPQNFNRPKVPPPVCRKCHAQLRDYGGYKKFIAAGINLSDFWEDVSPVRHEKHKTRKANELPKIIPERVISISGRKDGLFIDPFAGSGSSLIEAAQAGMFFVGCDSEQEYCTLILERLKNAAKNKVRKER
jgi:site-specific DNA-methyltransferase (adenine-specific)